MQRHHSIAPMPNGKFAFTDQDSRQLKVLEKSGTVAVIAGTGGKVIKMGLEATQLLGSQWACVLRVST